METLSTALYNAANTSVDSVSKYVLKNFLVHYIVLYVDIVLN